MFHKDEGSSSTAVQIDAGVMARLKAATADLHRHAESRDLQRAMAKGSLPRERFAAYLGQLYLVHQALEHHLRQQRGVHEALASVNHDYQRREPDLYRDLKFYGVNTDAIVPTPATTAIVEAIARLASADPAALLGMLYVLEGSNNGSKYIARSIGRAFGLQPGPGLAYLDPYGDLQPERWQAFKRDMDAVGFAEDEISGIVDAARVMFAAIADISEQVHEQTAIGVG